MDFKVRWMRQAPDGWHYALLLDLHTQNEVKVHCRWGSWMAGDPANPSGDRREVLPTVAAGLQAYKARETNRIKKVDPSASKGSNPFLQKKTAKKANPFLAKKKTNPFLKGKTA